MKRIIFVRINNYNNKYYQKLKEERQKSKIIAELKNRNIEFIIKKNKNYKNFELFVIGYDNYIKQQQKRFNNFNNIFKIIDKMPIRKKETKNTKNTKNTKFNSSKFSLYSNNNPTTTIKGTGFANKIKAENTIKLIKNLDPLRQKRIINTMYYRAMYHPYQTKDMKDAMKVFKKWLIKFS